MTTAQLRQLRLLLWLYFWLLILEGALRKWVLPGLSTPLLVVRDPVALLALWRGAPLLMQQRFQSWLQWLFGIATAALFLAMLVGHRDLFTAIFGTRILLIHLPLIFLYAAAFDRDGVLRFAKVLLLISIPMTFLIVAQSNLPDSHILNTAPGGEGTAAFQGALGRSRPPGTFSFTNGLSSFYTLAAAALFARLYGMGQSRARLLLLLAAGIGLVVALPVSISRTLLFSYVLVVVAVVCALLLSRARIIPLISGLLGILLVVLIGSSIPAFRNTSEAFTARWDMATAEEGKDEGVLGVIQKRVLGGYSSAFENRDAAPILGAGIGIGTNVGAQRLTGERAFLIAEGGWEAILGEMGLPLGFVFIAWRLALGWLLLELALRSAGQGNIVPLIFLSSSLLWVTSSSLGQATTLGFTVVSAGLTWAASNTPPPFIVLIPTTQLDPRTTPSPGLAPTAGHG